MKIFEKLLVSIILALSLMSAVLYNSLKNAKEELAATQTELKTRENVWWKIWSVADTNHDGLELSVPDYYKNNSSRSLILRNKDWAKDTKYEFPSNGKSAHFFREGVEVEWTLRMQ